MRFFLGGYGADMGGDADGIGVLHAGAPDDALAGGELAWAGSAAAAASPSWLAWHPTLDVVYAAQEGHGDVQAFRRTGPGVDFPAEIALSRDGRFAVVGVRGSNTLASLRVDGDGGSLASVALVESGVDWPRHHVIARDTVLVAGQRSSEIASLTLDERTGVPGRVRRRVEAPTPTALLADR